MHQLLPIVIAIVTTKNRKIRTVNHRKSIRLNVSTHTLTFTKPSSVCVVVRFNLCFSVWRFKSTHGSTVINLYEEILTRNKLHTLGNIGYQLKFIILVIVNNNKMIIDNKRDD